MIDTRRRAVRGAGRSCSDDGARRGDLPGRGRAVRGGAAARRSSWVRARRRTRRRIVTIVEMPPAIDWTGPGAQQRVQRLAADSLIEVTGGRAVIADELPGTTDSDVQAALRALGEDAANTLTFSITRRPGQAVGHGREPDPELHGAEADGRGLRGARRGPSRRRARRHRHGRGDRDRRRSTSTSTGNTGERWAAAAAIDEALDEAVRTFAPRHPHAAPADADRRGAAGRRRQPDAEARDAAAAVSRAVARADAGARRQPRALPGGRARCTSRRWGSRRAICWAFPGAETDASRAALARVGRPRRQAAGRRRARRPALHPFDVTAAPPRA